MIETTSRFHTNVKDPNKSKICFIVINTNDMIFTNSDFVGEIELEEYFCTSSDLTYGDTPSSRLSFTIIGTGIPDDYNFFTSDTGNPIIPMFGVEIARADYAFGDNVLAHIEVDDTGTTKVIEARTTGLYYDGTKIDNGVYNTLLCNNSGNFIAIPQTPDSANPQYALVDFSEGSYTITMNSLNAFMMRKFKSGASWSRLDSSTAKVWANGEVITYDLVSGGWFNCEIQNMSKTYIGDIYTFSDLSGIMTRNDDVTYYRMTPDQVSAYLDDEDTMKFPPVSYPMSLTTLCNTLNYLIPESIVVDTEFGVTQDIKNRFDSITVSSNPFHNRSVSFRQMLSWIGERTRTVAVETRASGGVVIPKWLNGFGTINTWMWGIDEHVSQSRIAQSDISLAYKDVLPTLRTVVEGVDGTVWDYDYSGSHPAPDKYSTYYIGGNPLITDFTQGDANAYCDDLPIYRPCSMTIIYADPSVEVGDTIEADCIYNPSDDSYDSVIFPLLHRRMTFNGVCFVAEYEASGGYQRQTNEFYDTQNRVTRNTNDIADIQESMSNYLTPETGVTSVNGSHGDVTVSDTKVTQTYASYSGYTYWRPLVVGSSAGSAETFTPSTVTNNVYTFSNIKVQPSTGTVKATTFKGNLTGTASGNLTSSSTLDPTKLSGVSSGTTKFLREDGSWETPAYPPDVSGSVTDILARLDNMKIATVTVPNGSTDVNFTSSTGTRGLLVCAGYSTGTKGVYIITCNTSGSVTYVTVTAGSNISFTTGTRKLTISNNSTASSVYAHFIFFAGGLA